MIWRQGYSAVGTSPPYYQCTLGSASQGIWYSAGSCANCTPTPTRPHTALHCTEATRRALYSFYPHSALCAAIPTYCSAASAPTLYNANIPTPVTTVNGTRAFFCVPDSIPSSRISFTAAGITYFTCNYGYASNGASQPYYQCLPDTATAGKWTNGVIYSCERMFPFRSLSLRSFLLLYFTRTCYTFSTIYNGVD